MLLNPIKMWGNKIARNKILRIEHKPFLNLLNQPMKRKGSAGNRLNRDGAKL